MTDEPLPLDEPELSIEETIRLQEEEADLLRLQEEAADDLLAIEGATEGERGEEP